MFIGHFALGFAAKKLNGKPSLGTYFLAAQFLDLLWPLFLITGIEHVQVDPGNTVFTPLDFVAYPYSHSLLAALVWSLVFAWVYYMVKKDHKGALLLGLIVLSHWLLDFVTHRPDLPLTPWNDGKYGLGLWNHKMATLLLELSIFIIGVYVYLASTTAKNAAGKYSLWGFILFLLLVYFLNAFGPPPESVKAIGFLGLSMWLLIAWGYWIDNNRLQQQANESRFLHHQIE